MKGKIALSVLGFTAAAAVGGFGVVSLLTDPAIIEPDTMVVESASLHVVVSASADWAGTNNTFTTETSSEGFMSDEWNMPELVLNETLQRAVLTINIENLSNTDAKLEIRGIGYDSEVLDANSYRFVTNVEQWSVLQDGSLGSYINSTPIYSGSPIYRLNTIEAGSSVILKVVYELTAENMPFTVNNDIVMAFNIITPGE